MSFEDVEVKVSSKRTSQSTVTPYGWSLAVTRDFLGDHPDLPERVQLVRAGDTIYVQFGEEGNAFNYVPSRWQWVQVTRRWLTNLQTPADHQPAVVVTGIYDDETHRITLNPHDYTNVMVEAMSNIRNQPRLSDAGDRFKTVPRGHRLRKAPPFFKRAPLPDDTHEEAEHPLLSHPRAVAALERQQSLSLTVATLPSTVSSWTDNNVKALRQLIMDLQMRRPEIVFSVVNGIVTMKKQTFEDI
jgi:hypothetical protein